MTAAVVWGLIIVAMTEILSLFHLVTFGGLTTSWLVVIVITIILIFRRIYLWCVENADYLFEDEVHEQDIRLALSALAHFNIFVFIMSVPSFVLLFHNMMDLLFGGSTEYDEDGDEEEEQA